MSTPHFELPFFTNLLILLVAAKILGEVFERFRQPAMIGEILAGILLGPSVANIIHRTEEVKVISELGIFLLVIIAGLEINIEGVLKSLRGRNIIISCIAFSFPMVSGYAVGYFFNLDIITSLFIGLCVAITALPVSIRMLMDLKQIHSDVGQKIISVAIFDDVLALSILGVLLQIKGTNQSMSATLQIIGLSILKLVFFILLLSTTYWFIQKLLKKGDYLQTSLNKLVGFSKGKEPLFALFFAFVLLFATFTENLGLHFIVGAFFASMLISSKLVGEENLKSISTTTHTMAMGFLAPIFFAGIGLEFNVHSISHLGLLAIVLLVSYGSKILGGLSGGLLAGLNKKTALTLGIGLNARGIMELVIANIAYKHGLISTEVFSILVIMGILTTLTTPMLLRYAFQKWT
jgi:Kef-type K+ transport system membrane component KefB